MNHVERIAALPAGTPVWVIDFCRYGARAVPGRLAYAGRGNQRLVRVPGESRNIFLRPAGRVYREILVTEAEAQDELRLAILVGYPNMTAQRVAWCAMLRAALPQLTLYREASHARDSA